MFMSIVGVFITFVSFAMVYCSSTTSTSHANVKSIQHLDSTTGLPLHSNVFREKLDIAKRNIHFGKDVPESFQKFKLNADAKLHPRRCIVLDVIESLQSVQCRFGIPREQLILTFASILDTFHVYRKWINAGVQFVSGSKEWDCRNETTQEPLVIIRRIRSLRVQSNKIILYTLQDTHLSPLVCFANITLNLVVEQGDPVEKVVLHEKHATFQKKSSSDSWFFTPTQPHGGELYSPGQMIPIQWNYSNTDGTNQLKIVLCRKRFGTDIRLQQVNTTIDQKNISFTIPSFINLSTNGEYYFEFEFSHQLSWHREKSGLFSISNESMITPETLSVDRPISLPGESVRIRWQSYNFDKTSIIIVRFRRVDISIDATLDTFTVLATAKSHIYKISSKLKRSNDDKYYYFEFDYCKISSKSHCKQRTNHILIPTRPYLLVTYPVKGDRFLPFQMLNLTWATFNFQNQSDLLDIRLFHSNVLSVDQEIDRFTCLVNSSGSCFYALPNVANAKLDDIYFQFNWCPNWYSVRCTVNSDRFSILKHTFGSWNYDPYRGVALESKELFAIDCEISCPTNDSSPSQVCQICNEGRSMDIKLSCINCWAIYDYNSIQIDLVRKDNSLTFDHFTVQIHSNISVNIDVSISAKYDGRFRGSLSLPSIPIIKPIPFTIGSVPFDLSLIFASSIPWLIDINLSDNLTIGMDYQLETNLTLTMNSNQNHLTPTFNRTLKRNYHPMEGHFQSNILVDVAYRPSFKLILALLTIELSTEGYLIVEGKWRYPPYHPLSTLTFDWNKEIISAIHLSIPYNACISSHMIRYHSMFGIRKTKLSFSMPTFVNYLSDQIQSYSTPSFFDLGPFELCSGCMLPFPQHQDSSHTMFVVLNREFNRTRNDDDQYVSKSILIDLAYALNVSQIHLYHNGSFSIQHNRMTGIMIIILPSFPMLDRDLSVSKLVGILEVEAENMNSPLYSGSLTKLIDFNETYKMNHLKETFTKEAAMM